MCYPRFFSDPNSSQEKFFDEAGSPYYCAVVSSPSSNVANKNASKAKEIKSDETNKLPPISSILHNKVESNLPKITEEKQQDIATTNVDNSNVADAGMTETVPETVFSSINTKKGEKIKMSKKKVLILKEIQRQLK